MLAEDMLACASHERERRRIARSDRSDRNLVAEDGNDDALRGRISSCLGIVEFDELESVLLGEGSQKTQGVGLSLFNGGSANGVRFDYIRKITYKAIRWLITADRSAWALCRTYQLQPQAER